MNGLSVTTDILEMKVTDLTGLTKIGGGGEAAVWKGYNGRFGTVAVKTYHGGIQANSMTEIELLIKHSRHPNIVQLYALLCSSNGYMGYLMEYMQIGSLADVIGKPQKYPYDRRQVYFWIQQIGRGLQHLHLNNIFHRDVKPDNILLGNTLNDLKVCDFGLARPDSTNTKTACQGTVHYMAPEVASSNRYGVSADVYSLTVTVWEIIHRKRPYCHLGPLQNYQLLDQVTRGVRPKIEEAYQMDSLMTRGWDKDPEKRPSITEFIDFARSQLESHVEAANKKKYILLLGGANKDDRIETDIYLLDYVNQAWEKLSHLSMPIKVLGHGAVIAGDEIFVFGGRDSDNWISRNVYKLNRHLEWQRMREMKEPRYGPSYVELNGAIWVMGGWDGQEMRSTVESYSPARNEWTPRPSMRRPRMSGSAAVINQRIYVCGNWTFIEYFDQLTQHWIEFCPAPSSSCGLTCVAFDLDFITLGGFADVCHNTCMSLDTKNCDEWMEMPSMLHCRTDFTAFRIGDEILAIGGCEEYHKPGITTEIYDGKGWREGPPLPVERAFYASVALTLEEADNIRSDWKFI